MRRDTAVFGLAGIVFGFVVGHMSASWSPPRGPAAVKASEAVPGVPTPDPNEARALADQAERDPDDVVVRVELGNLYMDHQRWDDAIRWYREALVLDPALPSVLTDLGACLVHSGRPAEGLVAFESALARDGTDRNALYNRGIALMRLGRSDEAVAAWEEVLRHHPNDPQLSGLPGRIENIKRTSPGTEP